MSPRHWGSRSDSGGGQHSARGTRAASPSRFSMGNLLGRRSSAANKPIEDDKGFDSTPDMTQRSEGTVSSESAQSPPQPAPPSAASQPVLAAARGAAPAPAAAPAAAAPRAQKAQSLNDDDTVFNTRELVKEQPDREFGSMTARKRAVMQEARELGQDARLLLQQTGDGGGGSGGGASSSAAAARSKNVMVQVAERARERALLKLAVATAREAEDAALKQLREVRGGLITDD